MTGECKDDQTFVGTFSAPYPDYEDMFNNDVLPAHILEKNAGCRRHHQGEQGHRRR